MEKILRTTIPFISNALIDEIKQVAVLKTFAAATPILSDGVYVKMIPIVLSGQVKVYREADVKELLLYYILPCESCFMSVSACVMNTKSKVQAITEVETELLLIPAQYVNLWMQKYPEWVNFIMQLSMHRFDELLETVDAISFSNLDERLLRFLNDKAKHLANNQIEITHQQIANELGSAREVISRLLKKLEIQDKIELHRGIIKLKKPLEI